MTGVKRPPRLTVVSGIPPGESGTGRFLAHLQSRLRELLGPSATVISRPERPALWQIGLWLRRKAYVAAIAAMIGYAARLGRFWIGASTLLLLRRHERMILLHPQNLGYRLALRLIRSRKTTSLIYLLDSSFFCVASYNHVQGESRPCIRCIEHGFGQIKQHGCKPFPRPDPAGFDFVPQLQNLVKEGRVRVAAQNARQAELAQRHFALPYAPPVVGLWAQDWDEVIAGTAVEASTSLGSSGYRWDVLFHAHCLEAKGAAWAARLATYCPELRFMFPFGRPPWFEAPPNCSFVPCTWENGLRDEIHRARFVMVPSLWSASIEGALVKSIACADAVVVVENPTSYSDELPARLVLRLSAMPQTAANELKRAFRGDWRPDAAVKSAWLNTFEGHKASFVPQLLKAALGDQRQGRG